MMKNNIYGLEYEDVNYENLRFLRRDTICDVSYMTFKDFITEEVMTFEEGKIINLAPSPADEILGGVFAGPLAESPQNSLY